MLGLVCVLCVAAVLGVSRPRAVLFLSTLTFSLSLPLSQRPGFGSTNSDLLCRSTKPPSNAQVWDFSLVLDQTGDEVLCDPFFLGLAQQMSNAVDIGQLGARARDMLPFCVCARRAYFFSLLRLSQRYASTSVPESLLVRSWSLSRHVFIFSPLCSYENSDEDFLAGSCVKGLGKLFSDIAALPGSSLLALRYVVRRGTDQNGNVVNNWRQQVRRREKKKETPKPPLRCLFFNLR